MWGSQASVLVLASAGVGPTKRRVSAGLFEGRQGRDQAYSALDEDQMSNFRPAKDAIPDEVARGSGAAGAVQAGAEDALAKLDRMLRGEFADPSASETKALPLARPAAEATRPFRARPLPETPVDRSETAAVSARDIPSREPNRANDARARRPRGWTLTVSALALAVAAVIGAVFTLEGRTSGEMPFDPVALGPAKAPAPGGETVKTAPDAGPPLLAGSAQLAPREAVDSGQRPVDRQGPAASAPSSAVGAMPGALGGATISQTVNAPAPVATKPPPTQVPDLRPAEMVSAKPNETPLAPPASPAPAVPLATPAAAAPVSPAAAAKPPPPAAIAAPVSSPEASTADQAPNPPEVSAHDRSEEKPSEPHRHHRKHAKLKNEARQREAARPVAEEPPAPPAETSAPAQGPPSPSPGPFTLFRAFGDSVRGKALGQ